MDSLEALLERYLAEGEEEAVSELVRRTKPRLLATARRIAGGADAEDCVQTAYLSLMHKRAGEMAAPVLPWLVTAVVRIAYGRRAQQRKQRELAARLARVPKDDATVSAAIQREEASLLRRHVARLPASFRDPVLLHYFQGLSAAEVGALLDLTPEAVRKRLERARTLLRSRWNPRVLGLVFALPWFLSDHAVAAVAGGLVMKKAAVVTGLLLVVALVGGVVALQDRSPPRSVRSAAAPAPVATDGVPVELDEQNGPDVTESPAPTGFFGVVVDDANEPVVGARVELRKSFRRQGTRDDTFSTATWRRRPGSRRARTAADASPSIRSTRTSRSPPSTFTWSRRTTRGPLRASIVTTRRRSG